MTQGPDVEALAKVAGLLLEQEALYPGSRRDAAMGQLRLTGSAADPTLERLVRRPTAKVAQARALEILSERGDADARQKLRAFLNDKDPEVAGAAIASLDAEHDLSLLLEALRSPSGPVREAAATELGRAEKHTKVQRALMDLARLDSLYTVRAAVLRALSGYKAQAKGAFVAGLKDSNPSVRLVAIDVSAQAQNPELEALLVPQLKQPPNTEGIETARVLALYGSKRIQAEGKAYLLKAIDSQDRQVRHQTAIALQTIPGMDEHHGALARAMERESEPDIKVALALCLKAESAYAEQVNKVFQGVLETSSMAAVQAASQLAQTDLKPHVVRVLEQLIQTGSVEVRAAAAHALARDAQEPDRARIALKAPHPRVRIEAAGGILAASSES
jgi:HEAT repeat protein